MSDIVATAAVEIVPEFDAFERALIDGLERPLDRASEVVQQIDLGFLDINKTIRKVGQTIKREINLEPQIAQVKKFQRELKSLERDVRSLSLEVRNNLAVDIRRVGFAIDNATDSTRGLLAAIKQVIDATEGLRNFALEVAVDVDLADITAAAAQFERIDATVNKIVSGTRAAEDAVRGLRRGLEGIASPDFFTDIADVLEFTADAIVGVQTLGAELSTAISQTTALAAGFATTNTQAAALVSSVASIAGAAQAAQAEVTDLAARLADVSSVQIDVNRGSGGFGVGAASAEAAAGGTFDALLNAAIQSKLLRENADAIADSFERAAKAQKDLRDGGDDDDGGLGAEPPRPGPTSPAGESRPPGIERRSPADDESLTRVEALRAELERVANLQKLIREQPIVEQKTVDLAGDLAANLREVADALAMAAAPATIGQIEDFLSQATGGPITLDFPSGAGDAAAAAAINERLARSQSDVRVATERATEAAEAEAVAFGQAAEAAADLSNELNGESVDTAANDATRALSLNTAAALANAAAYERD
ncbi:MAG TPA: hypothetical protein VM487_19150, partial [Phycisphaerae bacterium]|nr:hypothetical protein [Phycisphaerae bacterium]